MTGITGAGLFVGVDPGLDGAIVWARAASTFGMLIVCGVRRMPRVADKGRDALDLLAIRQLVVDLGPEAVWTVEQLDPLPASMGGGFANHARGAARGWAWMLTGMHRRHQLVRPQAWQGLYRGGKASKWSKARAKATATELGFATRHDGEADAFLLARWGAQRGAWAGDA